MRDSLYGLIKFSWFSFLTEDILFYIKHDSEILVSLFFYWSGSVGQIGSPKKSFSKYIEPKEKR